MLTNCGNDTLMIYHTHAGYMKPRDAPRMLDEDSNFTAVLIHLFLYSTKDALQIKEKI